MAMFFYLDNDIWLVNRARLGVYIPDVIVVEIVGRKKVC